MNAEIFDIAMPDKALIFVVSQDAERFFSFGKALSEIGAMEVGPQMFVIAITKDVADMVRDAIGELFEGESIYVMRPNGDHISHQVIVRPRSEGGIIAR